MSDPSYTLCGVREREKVSVTAIQNSVTDPRGVHEHLIIEPNPLST
jgi:hypothetical protein